MENQVENQKLINDTFSLVDDITNQIQKVEQESLKRIFIRYMLKKAVLGNLEQVKRQDFAGLTNYWEYYHNDYFLMSRELLIGEDGIPVLKIDYNHELVVNNEL